MFFNATLQLTSNIILLLVGFIVLAIAYNAKDSKIQEKFTYFGILLIGTSLILGSITLAIIGTPFLIQPFTSTWQPSCAYAGCYDPVLQHMEGSYGLSGTFASPLFAETSLGADYDVRAVDCEATYQELGNNYPNDPLWIIVSQIKTVDGQWIDYYYSQRPQPYGGTTTNPTQINTVYKVANSNEWILHNTGGETLSLQQGQRFITNKVRCKVYGSWQIPRYGRYLQLNGNVKVYGDVVVPTCSDGIKNQDEIEIDCGGTICQSCTGNPDVCGDGVCSGTETESSCPTDCASNPPDPDPEECGDGFHYEDINGTQQCVADLIPFNPFWIVMGLGLLGIGIALFILLRK